MGVARALAADPPVLLMDEPYSAVDPIVRARLQDELIALQRRVQKTIVLVTHDIDEAIKLADRIAILKVGGILAQVGPPEELLRAPADDFVADFLGDDRGIKRLSIMRVGHAQLTAGPVVAPGAPRPTRPGRSWRPRGPTGWPSSGRTSACAGWIGAAALSGDAPVAGGVGRAVRGGRPPRDQPQGRPRHRRHLPHAGGRGGRRRRPLPGRAHPRRPGRGGHPVTVGPLGGTLAADEPFVRWDWVGDHTDEIVGALWQHVQLTVVAVVIGFALALAMALVVTRWRWTFGPLAGFAAVVYAIPSLALFGVLVAIPAFGLGFRTAEVALVSYTLLILLRNIVAGLDGVPAATREAADGMGYERWRRLTAVDLPLAAPVIIAGLRIATVTTVGLVTVAGLVGEGRVRRADHRRPGPQLLHPHRRRRGGIGAAGGRARPGLRGRGAAADPVGPGPAG